MVTSFPQRWGQTSGQNDLTRVVWSRLTEMILTADRWPGKRVDFDSDAILDEIISTCLGFQPSFTLAGREYNYPDMFASEIAFVVSYCGLGTQYSQREGKLIAPPLLIFGRDTLWSNWSSSP